MLKRLLGYIALLVLLSLVLIACGGKDKKDDGGGDNNANDSTPAPEGTSPAGDDVLLGDAEISGYPMTRLVRAAQDLTLISYTVVQKDGYLYPMYLVRNDTGAVIENVSAIVTFLDAKNLRITDDSFVSAYVNIPPDHLVPLMGSYPVPVDYDGLATILVPESKETFDGYDPYFDAPVTTELRPDTLEAHGTATNNSGKALVQIAATFVLSDAAGNLIAVVPAVVTGLDENGLWQPDTALDIVGPITAFAGDSLTNVAKTDLIVAGYERNPPSRQP
ncbi:MAG: hypothetical protein HY862_06130 [Chloroflexi bacterium]|nr:hypothetical protein [Chloroflexota bacterium]